MTRLSYHGQRVASSLSLRLLRTFGGKRLTYKKLCLRPGDLALRLNCNNYGVGCKARAAPGSNDAEKMHNT